MDTIVITKVKLADVVCKDAGAQKSVTIILGGHTPNKFQYTVPPAMPLYAHLYNDEESFSKNRSLYDYVAFRNLSEIDGNQLLKVMKKDFLITQKKLQDIFLSLFNYMKVVHPEHKYGRITLLP